MFNIFNKKENAMEVKMRKEQYQVPQVQFVFRESGEFVTKTTSDLFDGKRVIVFSLPGSRTAPSS